MPARPSGRVAWRILLQGVVALYVGVLAARLFLPCPVFAPLQPSKRKANVKALNLLICLFFPLLAASCSKATPTNSVESAISSTKSAKGREALNEAAGAEACRILAKHWNVCGEFLITYQTNSFGGFDYVQLKGVSMKVTADGITEADRLNGIEWIGSVTFESEASRLHFPPEHKINTNGFLWERYPPGWTKWEPQDRGMLPVISLTKSNGSWYNPRFGGGNRLQGKQSVPCDKVPK